MSYVIALAGNPNSGKTTLFNELTGSMQHVGNWPGVTVDKKAGVYKKNKEAVIVDLPGIYSLSPYSVEEIIARDYIVKERPDVVINTIDGTSIERNLYLTLQIIEARVPMVIAVNMMDEVEDRGDKINFEQLSKILGIPVVPICARSNRGLDKLMDATIKVAEEKTIPKRLAIFDKNISKAVQSIKNILSDEDEDIVHWKSIKILEGDEIVTNEIDDYKKDSIKNIIKETEKNAEGDIEARIADLRYIFIGRLVKATVKKCNIKIVETESDKLDKILTNKFLALPIFAVVMYLLFACTFSENFLFIKGFKSPGVFLVSIVESIWSSISSIIEGSIMIYASPELQSLVMNGIMAGIGTVVESLPLVLVLYILISFLEDSGYMARVAFVMDRIFRKFGLSGRSFIPLLMGFGCGVPAIMSTRTLDSEKDRIITTIITGFMPCGAKLPIFALFISIFFKNHNKTLITYSIYMLSIIVAVIASLLLNKFIYKSETSNFIMELPKYRVPTMKSIGIHAFEKVKGFLVKAATVIFISTIIIWCLSNLNFDSFTGINIANNEDKSIMCEMNESFLAEAGNIIAPIFKPLGFGTWRPAVGIVTGWIAKENVVVTMSQLYDTDVTMEYLKEFFSKYDKEELRRLGFENGVFHEYQALKIYDENILSYGEDENAISSIKSDITNKASAYSYMIFNLLCMPCIAAVGAMKKELKTWHLTGTGILIQMTTAYTIAFLINIIGNMIL